MASGAARRRQEALRKLIREDAATATWRKCQKSHEICGLGEEAQRCSAFTSSHASSEDGRIERRPSSARWRLRCNGVDLYFADACPFAPFELHVLSRLGNLAAR